MLFGNSRKSQVAVIPHGVDLEGDGFAPYDGPLVCLSKAKRWRPEHVFDKDHKCIFCQKWRDG